MFTGKQKFDKGLHFRILDNSLYILSYRLNTTLYLDSIFSGLKSNRSKFVNVISLKSKLLGIMPTGFMMLDSFIVLGSWEAKTKTTFKIKNFKQVRVNC